MFGCCLCHNPEEYCYSSPLCSKCKEIQKIISIYGVDGSIFNGSNIL